MWKLTRRLGPIAANQASDTLTLPFELRMRGRLKARTESGQEVGLFLDRGPVLRDGEGLQAEGGEIVRIRAASEPVVTARVAAGLALARLCYHLGNRHVALAIGGDDGVADGPGWVRFPPDHVLEELAERLGARLTHHEASFDPEPGAYAQAGHGHAHGHDHSHGHAHAHEHPEHEHGH